MKIKKLLIFIFLAICLFGLASCTLSNDKPYEPQEFFVSYGIASKWADKAEIIGDTDLFVKKGETGPTVTVVTKEGYRFVRWLDTGSTNPTRTDENIQHDIITYAVIEGYLAKSVIFMANEGGKIEGNPEQILVYGKQGETVTAVPDEDFRFVRWSNGRTEASRSDNNLSDWDEVQYNDLFVYAEFERYQRNYKFNYNEATSGKTEKSVMITLDNISSLKLPVPARENYKFEGWFSDWHFTTRVSDADGKITVGKDWLQNEWLYSPTNNNPPGNLYAKWTATGRVPKYKILMLFITRIDVVLETAEGEKIKVDYTMSDIEKKFAKSKCCTSKTILTQYSTQRFVSK